MDVTTLTPLILPDIIRYLSAKIDNGENSREIMKDENSKNAQPWIGKLIQKVKESPGALNAAQRVASSPEDLRYQAALEAELQDILAADRNLAEEIKRIFDQAIGPARGEPAHKDNAPGNITIIGGVTQTGEGNIIGHHNQASSTKNVSARQGVTPEDLSLLLVQIREQIHASDLAEDDCETIDANLRAVEKESNKEKPRLPVIESSLKSIESMVKSTESISSIASKLLPLVHQAAEFARRLFL
jgi:hypothetical protein